MKATRQFNRGRYGEHFCGTTGLINVLLRLNLMAQCVGVSFKLLFGLKWQKKIIPKVSRGPSSSQPTVVGITAYKTPKLKLFQVF